MKTHFLTEVQAATIWPKTLDGSGIDKATRATTLEKFLFPFGTKWPTNLSSKCLPIRSPISVCLPGNKGVRELFEMHL